jgi:hypothetical protein
MFSCVLSADDRRIWSTRICDLKGVDVASRRRRHAGSKAVVVVQRRAVQQFANLKCVGARAFKWKTFRFLCFRYNSEEFFIYCATLYCALIAFYWFSQQWVGRDLYLRPLILKEPTYLFLLFTCFLENLL